jgi:effector-binding domain-containing protein
VTAAALSANNALLGHADGESNMQRSAYRLASHLILALVAGTWLMAWPNLVAAQTPAGEPPKDSPKDMPKDTPKDAPNEAAPAPSKDAPAAAPSEKADENAFGQETSLEERTIVYFKGNGTWDNAFDTITDALKSVYAYLDKEGIKPAGAPMTIYTSTDDTGFQFQAAVPVDQAPATPPKGDIAVGKSPGGKMYKFVHHGSYDSMDTTYEAITNFLDEKNIDAKDLFIEQYVTDPLKTAEDKLVIDIFVPLK